MKVQIQSVNFDSSNSLNEFVQKKMDKLDTFYDRILNGEVYLRQENENTKANKSAHVKIYMPGTSLYSEEHGESFEEAVDRAVDAVRKQLIRTKEKMANR